MNSILFADQNNFSDFFSFFSPPCQIIEIRTRMSIIGIHLQRSSVQNFESNEFS